ncbi:pyridoxamine 5'-phosphate oxidase family protein [Candidatus Omnitrophota bacterium]
MKKIPKEIIQFFENQGFGVVTTINPDGSLNSSCKDIIKITKAGKVFLLDLYMQKTHANLKRNPTVSITSVDEHKFRGYSLQGIAKTIAREKVSPQILKLQEERITSRITTRVLKNVHGEKGHPLHPEAALPKPKYLIEVDVTGYIDLAQYHPKRQK